MAFDTTKAINPTATLFGRSLMIQWTSTASAGTVFQVYLNGSIVYIGTANYCIVPPPSSKATIDIGAVASGEDNTSFYSSLPTYPGGGDRPLLQWFGGTYLVPNLAYFRIYRGATAGASVSGSPIATVDGRSPDGFGLGPFGFGGFGLSAGMFRWRSPRLTTGTWNFEVRTVDSVGNEGTGLAIPVTITAPPQSPTRNAAGKRLTGSYNAGTQVVTLSWTPATY